MARRPPARARRGIGCAGLLVVLAALATFLWVARDWTGPGPAPRDLTVTVPAGASMTGAAATLEKVGAVRSARRFRWFAKVFGSDEPVKAGEYRIPARLSQSAILKLLQGGKPLQRFVTIPEGLPSVMARDVLARTPELSGPVALPPEGSLLPDTYAYGDGDTRAAVVARMRRAMDRYLAEAWTRRKPGLPVTTPRQALILASIVEKETGKPAERRMVAAVYANRLKRGMMLQADPTIIYPITQGRPLGRRIRESEIHARNTYNTYAMTGLPAGPICNPGRASIDAALDPATSNALYFVADGTGGHAFADTLEQHNANVRKWRAIRK